MSLTLRAKTDTSACDGIHWQGIALAEKDEGANSSQSGDLKLLPAQLKPRRHILTQVRSRVVAFCEGFDTHKSIHRLHRSNLRNLWMAFSQRLAISAMERCESSRLAVLPACQHQHFPSSLPNQSPAASFLI